MARFAAVFPARDGRTGARAILRNHRDREGVKAKIARKMLKIERIWPETYLKCKKLGKKLKA